MNDKNLTVLCVVSNVDTSEAIGKMLCQHYATHKLVFATKGVEAVICIDEHKPDIFIIDSDMSAHDFALVTKEITAQNKASQTIAISARVNGEILEKYRNVGLQFCLTKPIDFDFLRVELDSLLDTLNRTPEADRFLDARSKFFVGADHPGGDKSEIQGGEEAEVATISSANKNEIMCTRCDGIGLIDPLPLVGVWSKVCLKCGGEGTVRCSACESGEEKDFSWP